MDLDSFLDCTTEPSRMHRAEDRQRKAALSRLECRWPVDSAGLTAVGQRAHGFAPPGLVVSAFHYTSPLGAASGFLNLQTSVLQGSGGTPT